MKIRLFFVSLMLSLLTFFPFMVMSGGKAACDTGQCGFFDDGSGVGGNEAAYQPTDQDRKNAEQYIIQVIMYFLQQQKEYSNMTERAQQEFIEGFLASSGPEIENLAKYLVSIRIPQENFVECESAYNLMEKNLFVKVLSFLIDCGGAGAFGKLILSTADKADKKEQNAIAGTQSPSQQVLPVAAAVKNDGKQVWQFRVVVSSVLSGLELLGGMALLVKLPVGCLQFIRFVKMENAKKDLEASLPAKGQDPFAYYFEGTKSGKALLEKIRKELDNYFARAKKNNSKKKGKKKQEDPVMTAVEESVDDTDSFSEDSALMVEPRG